MMLRGTLLFHLNLGYSSIEVGERAGVIRRCYRPLLDLLDGLPWLVVAVEASAHTLELAGELDPDWLDALRRLRAAGRIELVGSGDTQLIGPLVPAQVHRWNQQLGRRAYEAILDSAPTTALVNEMAWSQGLVDGYLDAGYRLLLMEWNNPRRNHPEWENAWRYGLSATASPTGRRIPLAWIDAIAFQKLQRAVVGDIDLDEYLAFLRGHRGEGPRHLFLYASDAEVFDHRPGRFGAEPRIRSDGGGEWNRMAELLAAVREEGLRFTTPGELAGDPAFAPGPDVVLSSAADPIPVKKQPKYNVTRWALSGWDDVGLNARCFARARELASRGAGEDEQRALCRAWASDHRTHLTPARWEVVRAEIAAPSPAPEAKPPPPLSVCEVTRDERVLSIRTDGLALELDLRRGLAIRSLAFPRLGPDRLLGTLPHGTFDDIHWAADFYSGHTVIEIPARSRITDLEPVEPEVDRRDGVVAVLAEVPTPLGPLPKRVLVFAERLELELDLSRLGERPLGSVRTAIVTLDPDAFGADGDLAVVCAHGGAPERFPLDGELDHGRGVSPLVSARAAFGATDGTLVIGDSRRELRLAWDPARSAALPLFTHRRIDGRRFLRVAFSLGEVDETHRPGASLGDFRLSIAAGEAPA